LKADGLAAGKGVYICKTLQDLEAACQAIFIDKIFGDAGTRAVLEHSNLALSFPISSTNGKEFQPLRFLKITNVCSMAMKVPTRVEWV